MGRGAKPSTSGKPSILRTHQPLGNRQPPETVNPLEIVDPWGPRLTVFQVDGFLPGEDPQETVNPLGNCQPRAAVNLREKITPWETVNLPGPGLTVSWVDGIPG